MLDDLRLHTRIQGSPGDDFLEQGRVHAAGAGEGDQDPTWTQQLECQQVDILVAARCLLGLGRCGRELGRVEDDHIERAAFVAEGAQEVEYIAFEGRVTGDE